MITFLGGAVSRFATGDRDVFRSTPAGTKGVLQTACFLLVPFANRQTFELTPSSLRIGLEIANRHRVMPFSLSFHPYFQSMPHTRLKQDVAAAWLSDDTCTPTERPGPSHFLDLANGAALAPFVDHCHFG